MKNLFYLLLAMPMLFTACNRGDEVVSEEMVQVSFSAALPQAIGTRATSSGLTVDHVVCAVFQNGTEISTLREIISIQDGQPIVFAPQLIKDRTYDIVFWASKEDAYEISNLTAIARKAGKTESEYDAFTESVQIKVTASKEDDVTLKRPLAQLNIGVTQEDWNAVVNSFNMTPSTMVLEIRGKSSFNALKGTAVGDDLPISYDLTCSGNDLTVNGTAYKSVASCYVLPEAQKENFTIAYTIKDQNSKVIREAQINSVPLEANYKTNVVGGLLTGKIEYTIDIEQGFNSSENNQTI